MKIADFPLFGSQVFSVTVEQNNAGSYTWQANAEANLWLDENRTWLKQGQTIAEVHGATSGIELMLSRKELPWLLVRHKDAQVFLQCAEPTDWLPLIGPLEICVDEKIADQLLRAGVVENADVSKAMTWCTQTFLIEGNPQRLAAVRFDSESPSDWQIIGTGWRADLELERNGKVIVKRIARSSQEIVSWTLIQGEISFTNASVEAHLMSESQQAALKQAIQSHGDYVDLWRKYSQHEWQQSLRAAAKLRAIPYKKCEEAGHEGGAWRFFVAPSELTEFRTAWLQLEADTTLALEAGQALPNWHDAHYQDLTKSDSRRRFRGRPRFEKQTIVIQSNDSPPGEGYLYLSLAGDRTVQERRQKALQAINTAPRSVKLRYILRGVNVPVPRLSLYQALTPNARECFKGGNATAAQEKAIKMALETPDICLIIGPPGTGKTQVIAALSTRLAEISGDATAQHQVLITSFQHDAVENALDRAKVYGLPPVKVGGRSQGEEDPIQYWCQRKYEELDEMVEALASQEAHVSLLRQLHQDISMLRHGQLEDSERRSLLDSMDSLLRELESKHRIRLSMTLKNDWQEYLEDLPRLSELRKSSTTEAALVIARKNARALRVTPEGFSDDGQDRATGLKLAIQAAKWEISQEDWAILTRIEVAERLDDVVTKEVCALRDRLLDSLLPDYRPPAVRNRLNTDGLRLINVIEVELDEKLKSSRLGISNVLARYRDTFLNHPSRTRATVREYAMVVGATCQQAASVAMASLKNLTGIDNTGITFENVIIDEAARANPLDLFIPMSMASKRVILVGDHRQLPHLLEPNVESELAEAHDLSEEQRRAFADSLFERLWRQLKDRESVDGFPRVVMLDTQFRMHPVLGEFVSKEFYEKENLPPLKPGRDATSFMNAIPGYEQKVCGWLDVPSSAGEEEKRGSSRVRISEAQHIALEVDRLIKKCGADVSIGVITFYSAQRDLIFEELNRLGITERDPEDGAWRVVLTLSLTSNGDEKLRIGTVDAFQGKEFDIVLLSIVRSNKYVLPLNQDDKETYERAVNRKYGHLRLSNRMNVAMSRQRSLLIAVGDKAMATNEHAHSVAPALAGFLQLCEGKHGVIR